MNYISYSTPLPINIGHTGKILVDCGFSLSKLEDQYINSYGLSVKNYENPSCFPRINSPWRYESELIDGSKPMKRLLRTSMSRLKI